ncbi:MAG: hypothetical protein LBS90_01520 [Oscillospiraceae bacterium]|jgi:hypothetical protein|nr:hypothetical protein [Oscillospiraceae bacterium]
MNDSSDFFAPVKHLEKGSTGFYINGDVIEWSSGDYPFSQITLYLDNGRRARALTVEETPCAIYISKFVTQEEAESAPPGEIRIPNPMFPERKNEVRIWGGNTADVFVSVAGGSW